MNFPVASYGVSEDRNSMIMPPHPTLSRGGRGNMIPAESDVMLNTLTLTSPAGGDGTVLPRSKLRGII